MTLPGVPLAAVVPLSRPPPVPGVLAGFSVVDPGLAVDRVHGDAPVSYTHLSGLSTGVPQRGWLHALNYHAGRRGNPKPAAGLPRRCSARAVRPSRSARAARYQVPQRRLGSGSDGGSRDVYKRQSLGRFQSCGTLTIS